MEERVYDTPLGTTAPRADDAGGVAGREDRKWFVAIVSNHAERKYADQLARIHGIASYVPVQKEVRRWRDGSLHTVMRVLIPASVFVYCTEQERLQYAVRMPSVRHFLTDRSRRSESGLSPVAEVPATQVDALRRMVEQSNSPVTVDSIPVHAGEAVEVVGAHPLHGFRGHVYEEPQTHLSYLVIYIDGLGCARVQMPKECLKKV